MLASVFQYLNFFRLHLLLFVLVPLLFSLVFYGLNNARNGNEAFVSYIDSLFLCVSAATVSGLYPVVLSNIEVGQQIILALLTAVGSYSFVSTVMVVVRRYYFHKEMEQKIKDDRIAILQTSSATKAEEAGISPLQPSNSQSLLKPGPPSHPNSGAHSRHDVSSVDSEQEHRSDNGCPQSTSLVSIPYPRSTRSHASNDRMSIVEGSLRRRAMGVNELALPVDATMRRTGTITREPGPAMTNANERMPGVRLQRSNTVVTHKDRGYGGFPSPFVTLRVLVTRLYSHFAPSLSNKLTRKLTLPRTQTLQSVRNVPLGAPPADSSVKVVPYLTFDAVVGKNSAFHNLSEEERQEIGGVELCALNMLAWIVPAYWFGMQLLGFVILAPYMARSEFRNALDSEDGQATPANSTWFSLFQVISSYANNGILVDASLVPLQKAYLLLWVMIVLILAGNTAFPCFLRLFIWLGSKCVRKNSRSYATLQFILDHPRRCFLYLFPSTQTWYLVAVLVGLNVVDWILFLLLDIGNPPIQGIPAGIRVMAGLFQAVAVRCGGFQIVNIGSLAPAVQVLYTVMMYVGALPVALGVRSTNVYEDRSIALYEQDPNDDDEPLIQRHPGKSKTQAWGEYMTWHLKRQLSFDLWWLSLAVFLICVFERGKIIDPNASYINVFSVIFEVVSAYGTVGLSLGVPNQNYSLSGVLGTPSKLVLCAVMLRGRHRGLPAAIDRSVLLPNELSRQGDMELEFRERQDLVRSALQVAKQHQRQQAEDDEEDVPPGMA